VTIPTWAQGADGVDFGGSGGYVTIDAAAGSIALCQSWMNSSIFSGKT